MSLSLSRFNMSANMGPQLQEPASPQGLQSGCLRVAVRQAPIRRESSFCAGGNPMEEREPDLARDPDDRA